MEMGGCGKVYGWVVPLMERKDWVGGRSRKGRFGKKGGLIWLKHYDGMLWILKYIEEINDE